MPYKLPEEQLAYQRRYKAKHKARLARQTAKYMAGLVRARRELHRCTKCTRDVPEGVLRCEPCKRQHREYVRELRRRKRAAIVHGTNARESQSQGVGCALTTSAISGSTR